MQETQGPKTSLQPLFVWEKAESSLDRHQKIKFRMTLYYLYLFICAD